MPDMKRLFDNVGVSLIQNTDDAWFGVSPDQGILAGNTITGSPAYEAGLEKGDRIISIGDYVLSKTIGFNAVLKNFKPGDKAKIVYERFGKLRETEITLGQNPRYAITLFENADLELNDKQKAMRAAWLAAKE